MTFVYERQRKLKVNMLRGLEKIPGLNLQHVIFCDETMYILIPKCGTVNSKLHNEFWDLVGLMS